MEPRRIALAVILMAIVLIVVPILFPTTPPGTAPLGADSVAVTPTEAAGAMSGAEGVVQTPTPGGAERQATAITGVLEDATVTAAPEPAPVVVDTAAVETPLATYRFSSLGAAMIGAEMRRYDVLDDDGKSVETQVEFAEPGDRLLAWRMLFPGGDTLELSRVPFTLARRDGAAGTDLEYTAQVRERLVRVTYRVLPDSYRVNVGIAVTGPNSDGYLVAQLPPRFRQAEASGDEGLRHLAYAFKPEKKSADAIAFGSLDPGEREVSQGPFEWVVAKNKYFLFGLLAVDGDPGFVELDVTGGARVEKAATQARGHVVLNLRNGAAGFELYAGPQEFRRMVAMGREFESANPYGGWLQGMIQPFATLVIKLLLWMKEQSALSYGWILVIFGVGVRVLLWPLNQRAMKNSLVMQQLQPELQAVQQRYKSDPQKMQQEVMKVYSANGVSPLTPLLGCLPMLLPMPILFALFFVFQNTIEFRGVPFLWIPDISLKDPFYIVPVVAAATAFIGSWINLKSTPDNQQAKIMAYAIPVIMLVFFANFAAGLNLYYAVQNVASLPQTWLIARERARAPKKTVVQGAPVKGTPAAGTPTGAARGGKRRG
jgi:YidC/Oxa1 family membrane protein insertase